MATADYRLVFGVAGEGLVGSTSSSVRVTVSACPGSAVAGARDPQVVCE
jgi:hypothetical protein